ncbi:MAG: hypothetical protein EPN79_11285 [Burkholderiaceae bacterium]|nr:MAG: hypothetical protein EPN79_11285 [Burkholderiaceae bacterium]TBR76734.1 MAG: hypothetical protein EPN64_05790 [Burkholderiaceae bacterium]
MKNGAVISKIPERFFHRRQREAVEPEVAVSPLPLDEISLLPHEFFTEDTWNEMTDAQCSARDQAIKQGAPLVLPLDAPAELRRLAGQLDRDQVLRNERANGSITVPGLPGAVFYIGGDALRVREAINGQVRTTFGGRDGFLAWARDKDMNQREVQIVCEFATDCWIARQIDSQRLRQAFIERGLAAGAQHGHEEFISKEYFMTEATATKTEAEKKEKGPAPVLRAVERDATTGEYTTTAVLWAAKEGAKVDLTGIVNGQRVAGFVNHQKDGGKAFISLSKEVEDGKFDRFGTGNAINAHKDGSTCHFDTVVFNVGGKAIFARATNAMSAELHEKLGFTSPRTPRPARPEPASEAHHEDEPEAAAAPRG